MKLPVNLSSKQEEVVCFVKVCVCDTRFIVIDEHGVRVLMSGCRSACHIAVGTGDG